MAGPHDPTRTAPPDDPRSMSALASDVLRQSSTLVQKEVQLARAELSDKASQVASALGRIVAGAILLGVSLGILLSSLVSFVARLLVGLFGDEAEAPALVAVEGLDENGTAVVRAVSETVGAQLDAARTLPTYEGLAALIVAVVFGLIGWLLLRGGLNALKLSSLAPERTIRQVREDGEAVRERV